MRPKIIFGIAFIGFLLWILSGDLKQKAENRPIKKITETTGLYLFGKRKIWTFSKSEKIYNQTGKLIEHLFYDGKNCDNKYLYAYTEFDSLVKSTWLTGKDLTPQDLKIWTYDSLNRKYQNLEFEISKIELDTFLNEKTTWYHDNNGKRYKTIVEHFSNRYPTTEVIIMTDNFDNAGLIISDTFYSANQFDTSIYITQYTYDSLHHIKTKFGGLSNDSIYYQTNNKGQIIEEKQQYGNFVRTCNKYWYDEKGNKIKTFLDIDNGHTYKYEYDDYHKLIREYRPGSFLFILSPCVIYEYEYY